MYAAEQIVLEADDEVIWAYRPPTAALEAELAETVRRLARAESVLDPAAPPEGPPPSAPAVTPRGAAPGLVARHHRARPGPRAVGRGRGGVRVAPLDRHRRPGHGQDGHDPADLRGGQAAARVDLARRAHRPRRAPDGGVDRDGRDHDPLRARMDPGQGPTKDEIEADLLVVDETSMANLELLVTLLRAVGPRDARGARRRRGPARARRRRQAVRGAGRDARGARRRAHAHLPPGRGQHDRPRRARRQARRAADLRGRREPAPRPLPDRARRPARRAGRDRLARHPAPAAALRRRPADRHPGLRPGLQGRARHRRHQHPAAARAQRARASRSSAAGCGSATS